MIRRRKTSTAGGPRPLVRRPPDKKRVGLRERIFWAAGLILLGLGIVYLLRSVFAILFAAIVFAYLLDPIIDRFEARGMKREVGIGILFTGIALACGFLMLVVVPSAGREFAELAGNVGAYVDGLQERLTQVHAIAEERLGQPIPITGEEILHELEVALVEDSGEEGGISTLLSDAAPDVGGRLAGILSTTLSGGFHFVIAVLNLALLPIFTFYLLRDWDRIIAGIDRMIPPRNRPIIRRLSKEIDERLASFVRGQTTVCLCLAVLYSLGLLLTGIDLAIVVGVVAGVLFIVPYLGTVVGVLLASLLAILKFGFDIHLLEVWAVFAIVQGIEGFVLTPYIVGDKVGLHPFVVMLALIVGGNLFGIWGMLLAIPVTAAAQVLLAEWSRRYQASQYFEEDAHRGDA
ncbi:MAG TPA: AI-2E family transporter [Myxococcota bacterium]|nr:AI-2E family transporter [Myxococcota bacterium]